MEQTGCMVCGAPIKARNLCAKHHQRFVRTGSVYLKNEKIEDPIDIESLIKKEEPKKKMNLYDLFR